MNTLDYYTLSKSDLINNNLKSIKINKDDESFYFKLSYKPGYKNIVVFSNGAYDPNKNKPPVFMRRSWVNDYKFSSLFIDDKTIHENGLRIG